MREKIKLSFIGCGKMAESLIYGIIKAETFLPENILATDIEPKQLENAKKNLGINIESSNQAACDFAEVIVLAVKPQNAEKALQGLKIENKLIISIAAGIRLGFFEKLLPACRIIRAMPNNPVLVSKGITVLSGSRSALKEDLQIAREIFSSVGEVVEEPEKLLDAVTGLSGSGPAFVYLFIEAMIEAGVFLGIERIKAEKLAAATVLGSAETVKASKKSPEVLRKMVTSPGGTTQAGLRVLEDGKFKETVIKAIVAAARRSNELSQ